MANKVVCVRFLVERSTQRYSMHLFVVVRITDDLDTKLSIVVIELLLSRPVGLTSYVYLMTNEHQCFTTLPMLELPENISV